GDHPFVLNILESEYVKGMLLKFFYVLKRQKKKEKRQKTKEKRQKTKEKRQRGWEEIAVRCDCFLKPFNFLNLNVFGARRLHG
ncbi:hypothetical protein DRI50_00070, partial [candidate division KSB1 bacterium]